MHVELSQPQDQDLLVRGLAHRMNNILTVFHGYVGLLMENDKLDPSMRDGLARIKAGARAATELIDRAHSLVKQPTVIWRQVDVAEFVEKMRPAIDSIQTGKGIEFEIFLPKKMPTVETDSGRLRSALIELVRNAFEATAGLPSAAVALTVSILPPEEAPKSDDVAADSAWIVFSVVDNGSGIPPELTQKVFHPFFSTKRKSDATGLGLNVAKGLIQQCGGLLRHESEKGRTCFELLLPVQRVG